MLSVSHLVRLLPVVALSLFALDAGAQSMRVQCPNGTTLHPSTDPSPNYTGTTTIPFTATDGTNIQYKSNGGAIKC